MLNVGFDKKSLYTQEVYVYIREDSEELAYWIL
jgi:hypothetical protein